MSEPNLERDEAVLRFAEMALFHRKRRQMTLRDVAPRIGISISHLSDIERGRTTPGLDIALRLARVLQFSLDDLVEIDSINSEIEAEDYRKGMARLQRARNDIAEGLTLMGYLGLRAGLRHVETAAPE